MKLIFLSLTFLLVCGSVAALEPDETEIVAQGIKQPLNRILLIQRKEFLGAVIFILFEKNKEGEFIRYRAYRSSSGGWQPDKNDMVGIRKPKWWEVVLGKLGVHTPPLSRIKPLELNEITLMALASPDRNHAIVCFGRSSEELDPTVKLAPTPWRRIEEVNLADGRLKWYRAYGPELTANIDELWK